ncbi:hypothetical protein P3T73_15800 [Kiritimatiellota bacterium B12222]|nr:hypothetical protein P3T73_15800 [Kiritimatiellota bacterium B12222]
MNISKITLKRLATGCALVVLPSLLMAQAYVIAPNGSKVEVEKIRVRSNGDLVVTVQGQSRDITTEQYLQAVGIKPDEIAQAQALIQQGKDDEAAVILAEVIQSSRYQSWDAFAAEKLALIQLENDKIFEAKSTLDGIQKIYGDNMLTFFPFMEKVQWDVKVSSGDIAGLEEQLTMVLKSPDSTAERKARALIVRGDLKASRKDYKLAVLDYLRAEYFFGDNADLRAEALYKTATMFANIGDTGRLRKYSTLLKETYPDSEYASKPIGS